MGFGRDVGEFVEGQDISEMDAKATMKILVESGMRGKLDLQSLLTGKLQVALSMFPGSQVHYVGIDKGVPEIPTLPSTIQQITKALEKLDLEGLAKDIREAVAGAKKLLTSPELAEAVTNLNQTLIDFDKLAIDARKLVNNVDAQVEPTFADLRRALNSADVAMKQAKKTLASFDNVIGEDSPIMWELYNTLIELRTMAREVNGLVSMLQRQPDSIIRGKSSLGR